MDMGDPQFEPPDLEKLAVEQGASAGTQHEQAASAVSIVLGRHHDTLMGMGGVTMVGEGADAFGRPAIIVGVMTPQDATTVPRSLEGVPVLTQVIGEVVAQPKR